MILTYSMLKDFKRCRRRFYFSQIEQLQPVVDHSSLAIGTIFHKIIAGLYRGVYQAYIDVERHIWELCNESANSIEQDGTVDSVVELLLAMFVNYHNGIFKSDIDRFDVYAIEMPIQLGFQSKEIGFIRYDENPTADMIVYRGIVDGIFKEKTTGDYYLHELKSSSRIPSGLSSSVAMDDQTSMYVWSVAKALGIEIKSAIYTIVRKNEIEPLRELKDGKLSKAKDQKTTPWIFANEVSARGLDIAEYEDTISALQEKMEKSIIREEVVKTQGDIEEAELSLWAIMAEIAALKNYGIYYRNPESPLMGGCFCPYKGICLDDTIEGRATFKLNDSNRYSDSQFNKLDKCSPHLLGGM